LGILTLDIETKEVIKVNGEKVMEPVCIVIREEDKSFFFNI